MASLDRVIYAGWLVVLGLGPILYSSTNVHRDNALFYEQEEHEQEKLTYHEQEEHTYHEQEEQPTEDSTQIITQTTLSSGTAVSTTIITTPAKLEATETHVDNQFFASNSELLSDGTPGNALSIMDIANGYSQSTSSSESFQSYILFKATPACSFPVETSSPTTEYESIHMFLGSIPTLSSGSDSFQKTTNESAQSPFSVILGIFIGIFVSYLTVSLSTYITQDQKRKHSVSKKICNLLANQPTIGRMVKLFSRQKGSFVSSAVQVDYYTDKSLVASRSLDKHFNPDTSEIMLSSLDVTCENEYSYIADRTCCIDNMDKSSDAAVGYTEDTAEATNAIPIQDEIQESAPDVLKSENGSVGEDKYTPGEEVYSLEEAFITMSESSGSDEELEPESHDGLHGTNLDRSGDLVGVSSEPTETRQEAIGFELPDSSGMRYVPPHKRAPSATMKYKNLDPSLYTDIPPSGKKSACNVPVASYPRKAKELTTWWQAEYEKFRIFMESRNEGAPMGEDFKMGGGMREGSNAGNELEWRQREVKPEQVTWLKWCTSRLRANPQRIVEENSVARANEEPAKETVDGSREACPRIGTSTPLSEKVAAPKSTVAPLTEGSASDTCTRTSEADECSKKERRRQAAIGQGQGNEIIYSTSAPSRVLLLHKDADSKAGASSSGGDTDARHSCVESDIQASAQASEPGRLGIRDFLPTVVDRPLADESADF